MKKIICKVILGVICFFLMSNLALSQVNPDNYEDDDTPCKAKFIIPDGESQHHNFHDDKDADYIIFYASSIGTYMFKASDLGKRCNVVFSLYKIDEEEIIVGVSNAEYGEDEEFLWEFGKEDWYLLKITNYVPDNIFGEYTGYKLSISEQLAPGGVANINGLIIDACTCERIVGAEIKTSDDETAYSEDGYVDSGECFSDLIGRYSITSHNQGKHTLTAQADGYKDYSCKFDLGEKGKVININMFKEDNLNEYMKHDINQNCRTDMPDVIMALGIITGIREKTCLNYDIGMEQVIYILKLLVNN